MSDISLQVSTGLSDEQMHMKADYINTPQHSYAIAITMTEPNTEHKSGEYLSDIKIAQILALDKVAISQRKIAALLKRGRKAIQNALANFLFEIFSGRNIT